MHKFENGPEIAPHPEVKSDLVTNQDIQQSIQEAKNLLDFSPSERSLTDSVGLYLDEVRKHKLLTSEQEIRLARRIERGDDQAKQELTVANLGLVVYFAAPFHRHSEDSSKLELLDHIQNGNKGLMRAVEKFDYRKGYKFSTYAAFWIRQAIRRGDDQQRSTIKVSTSVREQVRSIAKLQKDALLEAGEELTFEEAMGLFDISENDRTNIRASQKTVESLDAPTGEDSGLTLLHTVEDEDTPSPDEQAAENITKEFVRETVSKMKDPKRRNVIEARYLRSTELTVLQEVGDEFGFGRERARQLEQEGIEELAELING